MLRDSDGGASHAPAFLQARTEPRAEDAPAPARKPRVRRPSVPAPEADEG